MILAGKEIFSNLNKTIFIEPFELSNLTTNSYNLTLSNRLLVYRDTVLDMKRENETEEILIPDTGLVFQPGILYLGSTRERTKSTEYMPMIEGRSSIGRLGIFIHVTAGLGEVGFDGHWTLELTCVQPVRVYPGVRICQIYFQDVLGELELCNSKKYQCSLEAAGSKIFEEFE